MSKVAHKECPYADEIISYMYSEMAVDPARGFEDHLRDCQTCTDDFAAVSGARFEVFDWKRTEFDTLESPAIRIPYREKTARLGERVFAWVSWATAVPAFALILLALGIGYALWLSRGTLEAPVDVARSVPGVNTDQPVVAGLTPSTVALGSNEPKAANTLVPPERVRSVKSINTMPRVQYAKHLTPRVKLANDLAVNTRVVNAKKPPRLGNFEDEDDTSLRLAELFDETGPPKE